MCEDKNSKALEVLTFLPHKFQLFREIMTDGATSGHQMLVVPHLQERDFCRCLFELFLGGRLRFYQLSWFSSARQLLATLKTEAFLYLLVLVSFFSLNIISIVVRQGSNKKNKRKTQPFPDHTIETKTRSCYIKLEENWLDGNLRKVSIYKFQKGFRNLSICNREHRLSHIAIDHYTESLREQELSHLTL